MKDSKLIAVLARLNEKEMEQLGHFLSSNAFSAASAKAPNVISLFNILHSLHPQFSPEQLDKDKIYAQLFKGVKIKAGKIEKLMTILFQRIEDFIYLRGQFQESTAFKKQESLIQFYQSKKLAQLQINAIRKLEKSQKNLSIKTKENLYDDYLLQNILTSLQSLSNNRHSDLNLPNTIEALDIFYLAARLEYTCNLLAQESFHNIINAKNSYFILEQLKPVLNFKRFSNIPQIKVYSVVYEILDANQKDIALNLENIKNLEGLLIEYKNALPEILVISLHGFNRSLLMRVLNLGKREYTSAAFELYKAHLRSKVIFVNNTIHQGNYKNIASIGLMLNEFDWVRKFLKEYKNQVRGKDSPEDIYQFNLANCCFHQNKIQEAHDLLPQHFEDLYYRLAGKRLEIKILYLQEADLLDYKIKAFNQYIYRISTTILPEVARLGNKNFAKILLRILSPNNNSKAKRQKIIERILSLDSVKEKEWLLAILESA